jgi:hypothetical protein
MTRPPNTPAELQIGTWRAPFSRQRAADWCTFARLHAPSRLGRGAALPYDAMGGVSDRASGDRAGVTHRDLFANEMPRPTGSAR